MNPQTNQPQTINNPLVVMQENEQVICEIKRHPIGMLPVFIGSILTLVLIALVLFIVLPQTVTSIDTKELVGISTAIFLFILFITLGIVVIAHKVYWGNRWVLTSDSVTQISQISLFVRHSSQLSLGNLEDVASEQNGILPHMFNYGVLKCETAGERSKFMFVYCPNPNYYAQQILNARERFEQFKQRADAQALYNEVSQQSQPTPPVQK